MKVFGIGLNKTGTSSLCEALKLLGFDRSQNFDNSQGADIRWELTNYWKEGNLDPIVNYAKKYNNFEDWPWPLVYKRLYQEYTDAKFILTIRKSPQDWYNSLCHHAKTVNNNNFEKLIYGYYMPHDFKKEHIEFYNNHNENVINFFQHGEPKKLLILCMDEQDNWKKLCDFLGKQIPNKPFPFLNKRKEVLKVYNPWLIKIIGSFRNFKKI